MFVAINKQGMVNLLLLIIADFVIHGYDEWLGVVPSAIQLELEILYVCINRVLYMHS